MSVFDKIKITIEKHIIGKEIKFIKKVFVQEEFEPKHSVNLEEYFKKGLHAKKILKYKRDETSFRWVVWYI